MGWYVVSEWKNLEYVKKKFSDYLFFGCEVPVGSIHHVLLYVARSE